MDPLSPTGPTAIRRLAQQLEANFAAEMLRAARPAQRQGLFDRGAGAQAFDSFMDDALGDAMVKRGGFGLATAIETAITTRSPAR
jgi:Rod binding domain-containing protein